MESSGGTSKRDKLKNIENFINFVSNDKQEKIDEINEKIEDIINKFNQLHAEVENSLKQSKKLESSVEFIEEVKGKVTNLEHDTHNLKKAAKDHFKFRTEVEKINKNNEEIDNSFRSRLDEIEKFDYEEKSRFDVLQAIIISNYKNDMKSMEENLINMMDSNKTELQGAIENNASYITFQGKGIEALNNDIKKHQINIGALQEYAQAVNSNVTDNKTKIEENRNYLIGLNDRILNLEEFKAQTTENINTINGSIDDLNQQTTNIRDYNSKETSERREEDDKLSTRINELNELHSGLEQNMNNKFTETKGETDAIRAILAEIDNDNKDIHENITLVNKRNDKIIEQMNFLRGSENISMTDMNNTITRLREFVTQSVDMNNEKVEKLEDNNKKKLSNTIQICEQKVSEVTEKVDAIQVTTDANIEKFKKSVSKTVDDAIKDLEKLAQDSSTNINRFIGKSELTLEEIEEKFAQNKEESIQLAARAEESINKFDTKIEEIKNAEDNEINKLQNQVDILSNSTKEKQTIFQGKIEKKLETSLAKLSDINSQALEKNATMIHDIESIKEDIEKIQSDYEKTNVEFNSKIEETNALIASADETVKAEIKSDIDKKLDKIQDVYSSISETIEKLQSKSGVTLDDILNQVDELKATTTQQIAKMEDVSNNTTTQCMKEIIKMKEEVVGDFVKIKSEVSAIVEEKLAAYQDNISHKFHKVESNKKKLEKEIKGIKEKYEAFINGAEETVPEIISKIDDTRKYIDESNDKQQYNNQTLDRKVNDIKDKMDTNIARVEGIIAENKDDFEKSLQQITEKNTEISDEIQSVRSKAEDDSNLIKETLSQKIDDSIKQQNKFEATSKHEVETLHKMVEEFQTSTSTEISSIEAKTESTLNHKIKKLKSEIKNVKTQLNEITGENDGDNIPNILKRILSIEQSMQSIEGTKKDVSSDEYDGIKNRIEEINANYAQVKEEIESMIEEKIEKVTNLINDTKKESTTAMNGYVDLLAEQLDKITQQYKDIRGGSNISINELSERVEAINTDYQSKIAKHEDEINEMQSAKETTKNDIFDKVVNEFRPEIENIKQKERISHSSIKAINTSIAGINKQIEELPSNEALTKLSDRIKELSEETNKSFTAVTENSNETNERIDSLQNELNERKEFNSAVKKAIDGSTITLAQAGTEIGSLKETIESLSIEQNNLREYSESKIKHLTKEYKKVDGNINKSVAEINASITTSKETIETYNQTLKEDLTNKINAQVQLLQDEIQHTNQTLKDASETANAMNTETNDKFEEKISEINERINACNTALSKAEKHSKSNHDKLKKYMEEEPERMEDIKKEQEEGLNSFKEELKEDIKDLIKESIESNEENQVEEIKELKTGLSTLKGQILSITGGSEVTINQAVEKIEIIKEHVENISKESAEGLSKAVDDLNASINDNKESEERKFEEINNRIKENEDKQTKSFKDINSALSSNKEELLKKIIDVDGKINEKISQIAIKQEGDKKQAKSYSESLFNDLNAKIDESKTDIAKVSSAIDEIDNNYQLKLDAFKSETVKSTKKELKKAVKENNKEINNELEKFGEEKQKIFDNIKEIEKEINEVKSELNSIATVQCSDNSGAMKDALAKIDQVADQTKLQIETFKKQFSDFDKEQNKLSTFIKDSNSSQREIIEDLRDKSKALKESLESQIKLIETQQENNNHNIMNNIQSSNNKITDEMTKFKEENEEKINTTIENMEKKFQTLSTQIVSKATDSVSKQREFSANIEAEVKKLETKVNKEHAARIEELKERIEEQTKQSKQIEKDITTKINTLENNTNNNLLTINTENEFFTKKIDKISDTVKHLEDSFGDVKKDISNTQNETNADIELMKKTVNSVSISVSKLDRINTVNAEIEKFNMKFELLLANIRDFENNICNHLLSEVSETVAINSKKAKVSSPVKKRKTADNGEDEYIIENIKKDSEAGMLLNSALSVHNNVVLNVPSGFSLKWSTPIMICPYQSVVIQCTDKASILMEGLAKVGTLNVPTRAFVDAFASLTINKVTIKAITGANVNHPVQDMNSLFVLRSLDAAGKSRIEFNNAIIKSDVDIVNAGGSACAHATFNETKVSNDAKVKCVIHPITVVRGGYKQGIAYVVNKKSTLTNQVEWLENENINDSNKE